MVEGKGPQSLCNCKIVAAEYKKSKVRHASQRGYRIPILSANGNAVNSADEFQYNYYEEA